MSYRVVFMWHSQWLTGGHDLLWSMFPSCPQPRWLGLGGWKDELGREERIGEERRRWRHALACSLSRAQKARASFSDESQSAGGLSPLRSRARTLVTTRVAGISWKVFLYIGPGFDTLK